MKLYRECDDWLTGRSAKWIALTQKGVTGLPGNPRNHQSARNERFRQPDFAR